MARYEYEVNVGTGAANGEVIVDDDANDDEIRLAILNDLYYVTYRRLDSPEE